jgi:hypothetical protein
VPWLLLTKALGIWPAKWEKPWENDGKMIENDGNICFEL